MSTLTPEKWGGLEPLRSWIRRTFHIDEKKYLDVTVKVSEWAGDVGDRSVHVGVARVLETPSGVLELLGGGAGGESSLEGGSSGSLGFDAGAHDGIIGKWPGGPPLLVPEVPNEPPLVRCPCGCNLLVAGSHRAIKENARTLRKRLAGGMIYGIPIDPGDADMMIVAAWAIGAFCEREKPGLHDAWAKIPDFGEAPPPNP